MSRTLLVIEDAALLRNELVRHYRQEGWTVSEASTLEAARQRLREGGAEPFVVISDMNLPDGNALDLLEQMRGEQRGAAEWVFLTGYGTIPDSVRALRLGAFEFLEKPCPLDHLDLVVAGAERSARAQRRIQDQSGQQHRLYTPSAFVGHSPQVERLRELLVKLASVPFSSIVIGGETGTGKGLVARILHHSSSRAKGPLVEVNCAAVPGDLLESELFGHEAGSFTGAKGRHRGLMEQAHQGTLFLDEIGEMSPSLQAKLLKAIEDRRFRRIGGDHEIEVDVQILAASNLDLSERIAAGAFREDLYHRLSVVRLELPPLRERIDDLDELVPQIVAEYNAKAGKRVHRIDEGVWRRLRGHRWPGNVRELRNVIERCVLFADGEVLPEEWLQLPDPTAARPTAKAGEDVIQLPLDGSMKLDEMERFVIARILERCGGNVAAAARVLGVTRQTLRYRIQKHGLAGG